MTLPKGTSTLLTSPSTLIKAHWTGISDPAAITEAAEITEFNRILDSGHCNLIFPLSVTHGDHLAKNDWK